MQPPDVEHLVDEAREQIDHVPEGLVAAQVHLLVLECSVAFRRRSYRDPGW
jgi:hypothetical protein